MTELKPCVTLSSVCPVTGNRLIQCVSDPEELKRHCLIMDLFTEYSGNKANSQPGRSGAIIRHCLLFNFLILELDLAWLP